MNREINENIEELKEIYLISKSEVDRENYIHDALENKSLRYFTILTFIIGVYTFFLKSVVLNLIPPDSFIELVLILNCSISIICLLYSGICIFMVMKIRWIPKHSLTSNFSDIHKDGDLKTIFKEYIEKNIKSRDIKSKLSKKKGNILAIGFNSLNLGIIMIIINLIIYVIYFWQNKTTV